MVVLLVGGAALWWFVLRSDAPPPAALQSCDEASGEALVTDGTWEVQPGDEVFAGYRIDEQFGGDTLHRTVAGRSPDVTGTLELTDGELVRAEIEADLTTLASDEPRRDAYLHEHALETDTLPTATFVLDGTIGLPDGLTVGKGVTVDAAGELTLHDVTRSVEVPLDACLLDGGVIEVAGSLPIVLADYDIEPPDIPGLVQVEPDGTMEFQLRFAQAG